MAFKIGVIYRCERKGIKGIISYLKQRTIKEQPLTLGDFEASVVKAPFFGKITIKKLEKAKMRLQKCGCSVILKDIGIRGEAEHWELLELEAKVFLRIALKLYMEYIKILGLKAYKMKLLIADRNFLSVNMSIIESICFYSSRCDIKTENTQRAEYICDTVYKQNGFVMNVLKDEEPKGYDAVFDVDNKTMKIAGKVFINTFDAGILNVSGVNLSLLEMLKIFEEAGNKIGYKKTVGSKAYFDIKPKPENN